MAFESIPPASGELPGSIARLLALLDRWFEDV